MDGSKAIRGGIPLVFPQFGRPDESMPQHGFLRTNLWEVKEESKYDNDDAAGVTLKLPLDKVVNSRGGKWDMDTKYACVVSLTVKVTATALTTTLTITNTGDMEFDFQALLHTYLKVQNALSPETCNVTGLEGYECEDKITNETYKLGGDAIIIDCNVDRIYTAPENTKDLKVMVRTGTETSVEVAATATVDGTQIPVSAVVWNPHQVKAKEMSDFGDEQYKEMICVEPGMLTNIPPVGKEAVFTQTLTAM